MNLLSRTAQINFAWSDAAREAALEARKLGGQSALDQAHDSVSEALNSRIGNSPAPNAMTFKGNPHNLLENAGWKKTSEYDERGLGGKNIARYDHPEHPTAKVVVTHMPKVGNRTLQVQPK